MKVQRWAASVAAATVIVGGGLTVASVGLPNLVGAQTNTPTTIEAPAATALDWSSADEPLQKALDGLVADGTLTQTQADSVTSAYGDELSATVDKVKAELDEVKVQVLATLAAALDSTPDEVEAALTSGQSIGDLITAKGLDRQAVVDDLVAELTTHVDEAAAGGEVPAPIVAMVKSHLADVVDKAIDIKVPLAALALLEGGGDLSGLLEGMSGGR